MKHQVLFSLKNNEKIFMNVVCCSRDWPFSPRFVWTRICLNTRGPDITQFHFSYGPMNPINFLEGMWTDPKSYAIFGEFKTSKDLEDFIKRLGGWSNMVYIFLLFSFAAVLITLCLLGYKNQIEQRNTVGSVRFVSNLSMHLRHTE